MRGTIATLMLIYTKRLIFSIMGISMSPGAPAFEFAGAPSLRPLQGWGF